MAEDVKTEVIDPRVTAADEAKEFADLLVKAAKRRTEAAMSPGEVSAALKDSKDAAAAVLKAEADATAATDAIEAEALAEEARLATATAAEEVTKKAQAKKAEKTEAPV